MIGHLDGILYDGEGAKTQKVHLEQPQLLNRGHGKLGCGRPVLGAGKGNQILRGLRTDDDARRVDRGVPGQAFQAQAHVDQLVNALVIFIGIAKVRALFEGLLQSDAKRLRNHFGNGIDIAVGQIHNTADIADHTAGRHGTEGDDLHHAVPAVFFRDIVDDLAAALETEVHVYIGHGHALRVEEALKQKVVADGIDIGDAQRIGYDGSGCTASSGADHDPVLAGKINIIPDDEEIVDITHLTDGIQFVFKPCPQIRGGSTGIIRGSIIFIKDAGIAFLHSVTAELVEIGPGIIALGHVEVRELRDAELNIHAAAVRDALRVVQGLRGVRKEAAHLFFTLDIELSAGIAHAVLVRQLFACLDTQQDIVGLRVLRIGIVAVIGGDQRNSHLPAHTEQFRIDSLLVRISVVLQFQEKIALAENVQVALCGFTGTRGIPPDDLAGNFTGQAGGGGDDAFMEFTQKIKIHPGFIIKAFGEGAADNLHQVGIAGIVFRQQDQVIIAVLAVALLPVVTRPRRHIDLTPYDGIDTFFFCRLIKIDHAVHDAVIGNGRCRHAKRFHLAYVLGDLIGTVQKRVLGVDVKVREGHKISFCKPFVNRVCKAFRTPAAV